LFNVHVFVGARGRKTEPDARLLQCRLALTHAEGEVSRVEPRNDIAFLDGAAKIDRQFRNPSGGLKAEDDLLLGGKRSRDYDELFDGLLDRRDGRDAALTRVVGFCGVRMGSIDSGTGRGAASTGREAQQECEKNNAEDFHQNENLKVQM
jgi:hypothetical protein